VLSKAGWANNSELTRYCVEHRLVAPRAPDERRD
jgi:hypothetical protein